MIDGTHRCGADLDGGGLGGDSIDELDGTAQPLHLAPAVPAWLVLTGTGTECSLTAPASDL